MEYLRPGVYVERASSASPPIPTNGTSTAAFIGLARRGPLDTPVLVTSWSEFVAVFARGLSSPFYAGQDLAYAVYGFFQNGGTRAYIVRVLGATPAVSTAVIGGVTWSAAEVGIWSNSAKDDVGMEVTITSAGDVTDSLGATVASFDVQVDFDGVVVEKFNGVVNTVSDSRYFVDVINNGSKFLTVGAGTLVAGACTNFTGGTEGTAISDTVPYVGAANGKGMLSLDVIPEVNIIAIPGIATAGQALLDYCKGRGAFSVVDVAAGLSTTAALSAKESLIGAYGAVYYPWAKVVDPLISNRVRLTPPSGHIAGVIARTDKTRGVHKAPAGTEANLVGVVSFERSLSPGDIELLNPKGVNCLCARPGQGLVVWGARVATPNLDRVYVSDIRLDLHIEQSVNDGTQWAVFEPNDEVLWTKLQSQIGAFLYNIWKDGGLLGASANQAYFVKCDAELNTQEVRDAGKVIVEVGYARKKPAEFTIIRFTQKTATERGV